MSSEIEQLRQALLDTAANSPFPASIPPSTDSWQPQLAETPKDSVALYPTPDALILAQTSSPIIRDGSVASSTAYRILGNVGLSGSQVGECFRRYFARCHQHLPFKMRTHSHEDIYAECPLLFWVICAVTSNWEIRLLLAPMIKAMVADALHSFHRSIETVQALLILCIWPFPISSLGEDPSLFYSGIAVQMGLQLGLHCPTQSHSHLNGDKNLAPAGDSEIRLTTWLACLIINYTQAAHTGLPPTIPTSPSVHKALQHPAVDANLLWLYQVYDLQTRSTMAISTSGATASGMLEPGARLDAIQHWGEQFSSLQERLGQMNDVVKVSFLTVRLQLWSFGLLDDMPMSTDLLQIIKRAEEDACELIELCYDRNLNISPYSFRRAICYAAFVLVKILRSSQSAQREVLEDKIQHVRQALSSIATSPDDINHKVCQRLQDLLHLEDKKLSPPIMSRMGLSMMYDLLRIFVENRSEGLVQDNQISILDGFDWKFAAPYP
ncbi:hypothetical protein F5884DRAFT_806461 [Xylogone sp. PMI_703]|nr:hypothetical protein F5884DRAFT_806461 [Xylogone sp. PMI_703]